MFKEYLQYDGLGLAELLRKGEVSPTEVLEAAIARAEAVNPALNATVTPLYDYARERTSGALKGPFAHVPFLLKDVHHALKGTPMSNGSVLHKGEVSDHDAEIVRRYLDAGVVVFGKANTPEFKLSYVTNPVAWGPTRNPWDLDRTPGGSSGGSAAAVAAGIAPMATGTDEGGSIRIPSACCGVFGLKPSRGRNPIGPDFRWAFDGLSASHVITRTVRDSAAMLDVTAGPEPGSPYASPGGGDFLASLQEPPDKLRIGIFLGPNAYGLPMDGDCVEAIRHTGQALESLGHDVDEVELPFDDSEAVVTMVELGSADTAAFVAKLEEQYGAARVRKGTESPTRLLVRAGRSQSAERLADVRLKAQRLEHGMTQFHERYDALVLPSLGRVPVRSDYVDPSASERAVAGLLASPLGSPVFWFDGMLAWFIRQQTLLFARRLMQLTPVTNLTGQPAMSIPLYWTDDNLPCGVQFIGRYGDERTLLRLAAQLEEALPWRDRRPPIS